MGNAMWGRRQFSLGLGAAALGTLAPAMVRAQGAERIVLGQSAAFSGPAAELGVQFHAGAQLYFNAVNAQGGVGRRSIEIRTLDDGYEPVRCAENTRKFIADDVFSGAPALRQPFNRLVFHVRASYNDETALIVRQLTHLGLKKIAVFHQNDSYGKAGLDGVTLALAEQKLVPVASATVERNSVDVAAAVQKLVAAAPDAVVQVCTYASSAAFVRAARKAGYGGTFYNVSFVGTQALADALGKEGAGVVVSQVVPSPYQSTHPLTREFVASIKQGGGKVQPNYSSLEGYLAARVFTEGLRRASQDGSKALTRETLVSGLESVGTQALSGFQVAFGPNSHTASRFVEMSMLTGDGRVRT